MKCEHCGDTATFLVGESKIQVCRDCFESLYPDHETAREIEPGVGLRVPQLWAGDPPITPDFARLRKEEGERHAAYSAGAEVWAWLCDQMLGSGYDVNLGDFTDMGLRFGLLEEIPYNSAVHGVMEEVEEGDLIYAETAKARTLRAILKKGKDHP